jgi:metallo-beta-lactamase class B
LPHSIDGKNWPTCETRSKDYPNALADFERSYAFLDKTPFDILITPHPDFSHLWQRLEQRSSSPNALIDPAACRRLATTAREWLKTRLATEASR